MKSKQQENWAKTSCRECNLAIFEDNKQTACQAGRLKKFERIVHSYDDEKEFYIIDDACNYYSSKENDETLEDVVQRRKNKFGIVITVDEKNIDLASSVSSIIKAGYQKDKLSVIMVHRGNTDEAIKRQVIDALALLEGEDIPCKAVALSPTADMDYESFKHTSGCTHCCRIYAGQVFYPNTFAFINNFLNVSLGKSVYFSQVGDEDNNVNIILRKVISLRYLDYGEYSAFEAGVMEEAKREQLHTEIKHA